MKILHTMLSCFYIDRYNYQENVLPRQNAADGHEVRIIASTETFVENQRLGYLEPSRYVNEDGIPVARLPYSGWLPHPVMKKVRSYPGVYRLIEEFGPDVILFHGVPALELLTVARYKKDHPDVRLYVDSHEDAHNSGTNWISKWLLHRSLYRSIVSRALPQIDKILYVSLETKDFLTSAYRVPERLMEFYPLGGTVLSDEERRSRRAAVRAELGLDDGQILFVHSGKLDRLKRTEELLRAFSSVQDERFRMVLVGSVPDDLRSVLDPLIAADQRVSFVGWKKPDELLSFLCACDMYLQPGTQSATMQNALCASAPVMLYPHKSHEPFIAGNGFLVKTVEDMARSFADVSRHPARLADMGQASGALARHMLDYRSLAARLYS